MIIKIETIGLEETAQTARQKMKEKNVSSLVVLDVNNQAVGMLHLLLQDIISYFKFLSANSNN